MKDWLRPWVPGDDDLQGLVLATVEAGNNAVKYAGPEARHLPVRFDFCVDDFGF